MRRFEFGAFGLENLCLVEREPAVPAAGEAVLDVRAVSLNFRDVLVLRGAYNPKLALPATPLSDAAGVISAVGPGVEGLRVGDRCMTHYLPAWQSGPYRFEYLKTSLGTPGPGVAATEVTLPAGALMRMPAGLDFDTACTLPIAALTAWSALVTVGNVRPGETVLVLGTGGVAVFVVQLATALGARVIITSSRGDKLDRARELGAWETVNYRERPRWEDEVLRITEGEGVDLTVETGGGGTLNASLAATRAGGTIAFLGALTGLQADVRLPLLMMKRIRLEGVVVDSRARFEELAGFIERQKLVPVIGRRGAFDALPAELTAMAEGSHFGKIVLTRNAD